MADINPLLDLMQALRDPENGCPWDIAQTPESLLRYSAEEYAELSEAILAKKPDAIAEELGDLLFHLVFYSQIAKERGQFDFADVINRVVKKMRYRHPHVFAGKQYADIAAQKADWEVLKAEEKAQAATTQALPKVLSASALLQAEKMQTVLARYGFDWDDVAPVFAKVAEEVDELRAEIAPTWQPKTPPTQAMQEEYGDLLFAVVNLGRHLGIDAELALRQANQKFYQRSEQMVAQAGDLSAFAALSLEEQEILWQQVKRL